MNADVSVEDVMDREYVGVSESDGLVDTVELLLRQEAETAVVQRGSEHVGVLTQRDVLATLVEGPDPQEATVGDAMTESVPTVSPETSLDVAADRMATWDARRLVVTNGTEPLGVVTERDLLASRTRDLEPEQLGETPLAVGDGPTLDAGDSGERDQFQQQGICEGCGTFAGDLSGFNGQLLCADCRTM